MNFDWQTIAVALIIFAACAYTGRRAWARLRSLRGGTNANSPACSTGCGSCGEANELKKATLTAKPLVQIGRSSGAPRQRVN